MNVCKFFMQGNCKYGDRCYYEHPRGNSPARGGGRSVTFRDSFGTASQQNPYRWNSANTNSAGLQQSQQTGSSSIQDIIKNLPREIEIWQTSKMWPFSCFALDKEIPSLPDFVDTSPEELRLDAYTAKDQGILDMHKQKVMQLAQEFRQKQDHIKSMSAVLQQKLIDMLKEGRNQRGIMGSDQSLVKPSIFGQSEGNLFGVNSSSTSLFGKSAIATAISSPFGNGAVLESAFGMAGSTAPCIFGQRPGTATSVFSNSQTAGGTSFLFGQTQPAAGLFGKSTSEGNIDGLFTQQISASPSGGLFGNGLTTSGSVFGQSAGTGSIFGQCTGTGSVFGQQTSNSGFGQLAATNSGTISDLFSIRPSDSSVFSCSSGTSPENSITTQPVPGLFKSGNPLSSQVSEIFISGAAQTQIPANNSLYTPMIELTADEKAQFEAAAFIPGMIPMRPPPRDMINI